MNTQSTVHHAYTPDRGPMVFAITTATLVLATVFVAARMISRQLIIGRLTGDDIIMALAWLIAFFLSFTIDLGAVNGLGRLDKDIPPPQLEILRRCEYVFSILYNPALMATKTSIALFLLSLFKDTQIVLRWASYALLAIGNMAGLILTIMNIFQCSPVQSAWDPSHAGSITCIPLLTEFLCAAPLNIISNLVLLALPIPVLTEVRLPRRQKTILVITFLLSVFVTVVDVIRISYLQEAINIAPITPSANTNSEFGGQADFSWNASYSFMWSAVEVNVGIACACIPKLKPLVSKLLPSILYDPHSRNHTQPDRSHIPDRDCAQQDSNQDSNQVALPSEALLRAEDTVSQPEDDSGMTAVEFLTGPSGRGSGHSQGSLRNWSRDSESAVYFGFVNMAKPKSMIQTSTSESLRYCSVVIILFALWGASYGLLNKLNIVVSVVGYMSPAQTLGLTSVYFGGGYLVGPLLVGEWIFQRYEHSHSKRHAQSKEDSIGGFKACFIIGLCVYGTGTIIFWPSAVTTSFGGYMLSNFLTGVGLSTLEVAANAFLVLCGPEAYAETRILWAQGVQGVGAVISGVIANDVFFKSLSDDNLPSSTTLINVQWTYLGITLLCAALALFFYYMPLPEVSDVELEEAAAQLPVNSKGRSIFGLQLRTITLGFAVVAMFFYVGAQESKNLYFKDLMVSITPNRPSGGDKAAQGYQHLGDDKPLGASIDIADYLLVGRSVFALSRLIVGYLIYLSVQYKKLPRPRTWLLLLVLSYLICSLVIVVLPTTDPNILFIPLALLFFSEGPIWPLIFATGLRGQGCRTKRAAAIITMGASGASWPIFAMYGIIIHRGSVKTAFAIVVALLTLVLMYPIFLRSSRSAELLVDWRSYAQTDLASNESSVDTTDAIVPRLQTHGLTDEKTPTVPQRVLRTLESCNENLVRKLSNTAYSQHDDEIMSPRSDSAIVIHHGS